MSDRYYNNSDPSLFPTLLVVLFIGLKLGGVIDWSWWWVLSPFWIAAFIAITIAAVLWLVLFLEGR